MRRLTSRQNPIVARYRAAARGDADGLLLLDGAHLVAEALDAGVRIVSAAVLASDQHAQTQTLVSRLESAGVDVVAAAPPVMAALSPVRTSSGIVALAERPAHDGSGLDRPAALIVVAVDVQDPGNVGAVLRVAEAAGASGAFIVGASADPFGWKALRGSMGSALRLPVRVTKDSPLAELKRRGCRIIATVPRDGRSVFDIDLADSTAVVIGGEGHGLGAALVDEADDRVTIPMAAPVESLNVAVAAAVILYEARRQRLLNDR